MKNERTMAMKKRYSINLYTNKAINIIYVTNIAQIVLLAFVTYTFVLYDNQQNLFKDNLDILMFFLVSISLVNNYIAIRDIKSIKHLHIQNVMQSKTLDEINDLNNTLRAQRHDFLNHLQVVYSLIELKSYDEVSNYIEMVYKDIKKVNRILKTSNTAINALLQAKVVDCEDNNILTDVKITTRLEELKVPSWEMCRVIGNLIDNAIDAVKYIAEKQFITIEINEVRDSYFFVVKNNGGIISNDMVDKIFVPGYTTKNEKNRGMGLAIVKEIVSKYHGDISVSSDDKVTAFSVKIPKRYN
ncbi:sensor histidine kinase [Brassicibacter mesophilus]|uniref:sensor histidine kinase n=1 Tax=Brassicibacter mesophilus TaxID=745119 RepID=UPI003D1B5FC7